MPCPASLLSRRNPRSRTRALSDAGMPGPLSSTVSCTLSLTTTAIIFTLPEPYLQALSSKFPNNSMRSRSSPGKSAGETCFKKSMFFSWYTFFIVVTSLSITGPTGVKFRNSLLELDTARSSWYETISVIRVTCWSIAAATCLTVWSGFSASAFRIASGVFRLCARSASVVR